MSADRLLVGGLRLAGGRGAGAVGRRARLPHRPRRAGEPDVDVRADRTARGFAELDDELAGGTADVVVTDHHRDELGELLRDALARPARWIGVMGNPRHEGPHVAALTALGVPAGGDRPGAPADRAGHRLEAAGGDRRLDAGRAARRPQRPRRRLRARRLTPCRGRRPARRRPGHQRAEARRPGRSRDRSSPRPRPATRSTVRRPAGPRPTSRTWRRALDDALAAAGPALGGAGCGRSASPGRCTAPSSSDDAGAALRPAAAVARPAGRRRAGPLAGAAGGRPGRAGQPAGARDDRADAGLAGAARAGRRRRGPPAVLLPKDALRAALLPGGGRSPTAATPRRPCCGTSSPTTGPPPPSRAAGIDPALLPARPARDRGRRAPRRCPIGEVPVVVGGADTPLALLAAGTAAAPQVNLGTGAQLLRPGWCPRPADDPVVHGYADAVGGWYAMAALQNGGSAWEWVCGVLGLSWAELFEAAASAPAGAGGVVFRPFLTGERGGVARPGRPRRLDRAAPRRPPARTWRGPRSRGSVFAIAAAFDLLDVPDAVTIRSSSPAAARGRRLVQQLLPTSCAGRSGTWRCAAPRRSAAALLAGRGVGAGRRPGRTPAAAAEPCGRAGPRAAVAAGRRPTARRPARGTGPTQLVDRLGQPDVGEGGLVQRAVGGQRAAAAGPGAPVRSVNRPPASRTITSRAARSQTDTSGSQAMSTAPSASST